MLGEGANHGDGATEQFKAQLVRELIEKCGFDTVLFEASFYEFNELNRQVSLGDRIDENTLRAALGGLWKDDSEIQPLIKFLADKANGKQIFLGGLDDQLGAAGQQFSNDLLGLQLFAALPLARSEECAARLRQRVYFDFPTEQAYRPSEQLALFECIDEAVVAMRRGKRTDLLVQARGLRRWIGRDFMDEEQKIQGREESMFCNFKWYEKRKGKGSKIIIWGATVHLAKASARGTARQPLGALIAQHFGDGASTIGFTALGGSVRQGKRQIIDLPSPPPGSLEDLASSEMNGEAAFFGHGWLARAGTVESAALRHRFQTENWSLILDGIVVFRKEQPTTLIDR
ncbi:erythromycin esterase family protein [Novosphingopyxis iocasae]|uniref:erythromycin esterase family protein n=1 Tax=Novosphingopyxis iocasae TaxID=2762729 RepID=UPI0016514034|nr:erythromycin esterase family protein [Novosphingopyxis iocasae]